MLTVIPEFARLDQKIVYDNSLERKEIIEIPCSKSTTQSLNDANSQLAFTYNGDFLYRLASPKTGFLVRVRYRTRANNATNRNAAITLASNFFGYMFETASLKLCGTPIETIRHPGIVMDCFNHMENNELTGASGQKYGFVPDTSSEASENIGERQGTLAGADAAAVVASANQADNKAVKFNAAGFNAGFVRRRRLYNYPVANDDDYREVELFIPLNKIFGFCEEVNRSLKYVPFEVELIRAGRNTHSVYGAANTAMNFGGGDADSGLMAITLNLERLTFQPKVMTTVESLLGRPITVAFLRRQCEEHGQINTDRTSKYTKTLSANDEGLLRYVFCVFKSSENDTAQTNFQLCAHANIQHIRVSYAGNEYPPLPQNEDFTRNAFVKFYDGFTDIVQAMDKCTALSMDQFRDLYTIYGIDVSAQPVVSQSSTCSISVERKEVPANNDDYRNPRSIRGFFVFVSECRLEIDALKRTVRRI